MTIITRAEIDRINDMDDSDAKTAAWSHLCGEGTPHSEEFAHYCGQQYVCALDDGFVVYAGEANEDGKLVVVAPEDQIIPA